MQLSTVTQSDQKHNKLLACNYIFFIIVFYFYFYFYGERIRFISLKRRGNSENNSLITQPINKSIKKMHFLITGVLAKKKGVLLYVFFFFLVIPSGANCYLCFCGLYL